MKTYLGRIKENKVNGIIMYQPQIKRKTFLSFLCDWDCLSMLIISKDEPQQSKIKIWTEYRNEAYTELYRFSYIHKVRLIFV